MCQCMKAYINTELEGYYPDKFRIPQYCSISNHCAWISSDGIASAEPVYMFCWQSSCTCIIVMVRHNVYIATMWMAFWVTNQIGFSI